jgi:hypothetical protein
MNYIEMYKKWIESDKQKFKAFIKKHGYIENLGQAEQREFSDKVFGNKNLDYAEQAGLSMDYIEMLNNL